MKATFTEGLTVNGREIDLDHAADQPIRENFLQMFEGVATAHGLTKAQKDYILEMLNDQFFTELETATALRDRA